MKRHIACVTFDVDAMSGLVAREYDQRAPFKPSAAR